MRCVIAVDDAGMISSAEQDAAHVEVEMLQNCGDVFEFVTHDPIGLRNAPRADVYVIDFGGLGSGLSTTLASLCARQLQVLVEKHPGSLFLLWSAFTGRWYRDEIEAEAGDLPANVRVYAACSDEFWHGVRAWLGIEHAPLATPELEAKIDEATHRCDAVTAPAAVVEPAQPASNGNTDETVAVAVGKVAESIPTLEEVLALSLPAYTVNAKYTKTNDGKPEYGDTVGELRVPVRISHRPDLQMGFARFKLADCLLDVYTDDAQERRCASLGGEMAGFYSFSFPLADSPGECVTYMLTPQDLWQAILPVHAAYVQQHIRCVDNAPTQRAE